jgi:hypothetical protein
MSCEVKGRGRTGDRCYDISDCKLTLGVHGFSLGSLSLLAFWYCLEVLPSFLLARSSSCLFPTTNLRLRFTTSHLPQPCLQDCFCYFQRHCHSRNTQPNNYTEAGNTQAKSLMAEQGTMHTIKASAEDETKTRHKQRELKFLLSLMQQPSRATLSKSPTSQTPMISFEQFVSSRFVPIEERFLSRLDKLETIPLSRTSKHFHYKITKRRKKLQFNLNSRLRTFFMQPVAFRCLQAR